MPCAEIADAIVQTARTTLERAIRLIEGNAAWRARVVYGAQRWHHWLMVCMCYSDRHAHFQRLSNATCCRRHRFNVRSPARPVRR